MKILNDKLNKITILHMPGNGTVEACSKIIASQKNNLIIKDDNISIIVIATKNYIKDSPVIHQLNINNIRYYNGAENVDEKGWTNSLKLQYIANNLAKIKTRYTLILDARDTLICNNLGKSFINTYHNFNCKILFNASAFRYPGWLYIKGMDDKCENSIKSRPFLNSGVCFGETKYLRYLYNRAAENYDNPKYHLLADAGQDQLMLKFTALNDKLKLNTFIKIDNEATLFKCIHQSNNPDYLCVREFDNYIIKNNLFKDYKGRRYKKKLKIKVGRTKLILYPNYKNHEKEVEDFYNAVKQIKSK